MSFLNMDFSYKPSRIFANTKNILTDTPKVLGDVLTGVKQTLTHGKNFGVDMIKTAWNTVGDLINRTRNMVGNAIQGTTSLVPIVNGFGHAIGEIIKPGAAPTPPPAPVAK